MKILWTHLLVALSAITCGQEIPDNPNVDPRIEFFPLRVTVCIVDEDGQPVEGASVDIGVPNFTRYKDGLNNFVGRTKADGTFTVESLASGSTMPIVVTKEGYYISRVFYEGMENDPEKARKVGRFEPWNPTVDIVLKKIGKPIPMLVRLGNSCEKLLPDVGSAFPFDLMSWDWLPPHGKGKVADLLIQVDERKEGDEVLSSSFELRFANEHDGMIPIMELHGVESVLKSPRTAPDSGYDMSEFRRENQKGNISTYEDLEKLPKGYFFRIRTQVNAAGEIVSAYYGKIIRMDLRRGGLPSVGYNRSGGWRGKAAFMFNSCYINPTPNDRNLEYDQRNNLAPEVEPGGTWPP